MISKKTITSAKDSQNQNQNLSLVKTGKKGNKAKQKSNVFTGLYKIMNIRNIKV